MTHSEPSPRGSSAEAPSYYLRTFGCQMNTHDSQRMQALLEAQGYRAAPSAEQADVVIVNTCEVRDKADQKMLSAVGRFRQTKQDRPGQIVVVAGCGAQLRGAGLLQRNVHVDIVLGPDQIARLPQLIEQARGSEQALIATDWWQGAGADPAQRAPGEASMVGCTAFVTAMTGCNNHCTYCIVPTTRGAERSRSLDAIVAECGDLVAGGVREITLLGQSVNAYGRTEKEAAGFGELLRAVAAIPDLLRLRFMTSHPAFVDAAMVQAFAEEPVICSHLHLPMQSGSDKILRAMRRRYSVDQLRRVVADLRQARPDLSLTTDVIVGFPGETEADFEQTLALLEELGYDAFFSFAYSERPGTPAVGLHDGVDPELRQQRLARLNALQEQRARAALQSYLHQEVEVLIEGASTRDPTARSGRIPQNIVVNFAGDMSEGQIARVQIEAIKANTLFGRQLG